MRRFNPIVTYVYCILLPLPFLVAAKNNAPCYHYKHLLVLVHGYLGSHKEQSYLGETLETKAAPLNNTSYCHHHEFIVHLAKANDDKKDTTDGVILGGQRLAKEIWILIHLQLEKQKEEPDNTILTLSFVGNSLGGLFARYAVAELFHDHPGVHNQVLPLIFGTTSSPHLGVSQETFLPLTRWAEEMVGNAMQQTGRDLFLLDSVVQDMCTQNRYLQALEQFQKRFLLANAYNTDFLVSVSSGAFVEEKSQSPHYTLTDQDPSRMENEHVVLQVQTPQQSNEPGPSCGSNLDRLGWHKIFLDTRSTLPSWLNFKNNTPPIPKNQSSYQSGELQDLFARYGTLLPIAHPLNMANSKTDWYSQLTVAGRPIMDALADLLIHDMKHFSESYTRQQQHGEDQESKGDPANEDRSETLDPEAGTDSEQDDNFEREEL